MRTQHNGGVVYMMPHYAYDPEGYEYAEEESGSHPGLVRYDRRHYHHADAEHFQSHSRSARYAETHHQQFHPRDTESYRYAEIPVQPLHPGHTESSQRHLSSAQYANRQQYHQEDTESSLSHSSSIQYAESRPYHQEDTGIHPPAAQYDDRQQYHQEDSETLVAAALFGDPHPQEEVEVHPSPVRYAFLPPAPPEQRDNNNQERAITPTISDSALQVTDNDVLCGRGAPNIHHPGNQYFRSLVRRRQREYSSLRRQDKCMVVRSVLNAIEESSGRFLRQMSNGEWVIVHEAIAYEKVCQALREFQKTRNKIRRGTTTNR